MIALLAPWIVFASVAQAAPTEREDPRLELGRALLEFEARFASAAPDETTIRRVDAEFDRITLSFFSGALKPALESLETLTASLPGASAPSRALDPIPSDLDVVREAVDAKLEYLLAKEQLPRLRSAIRLAMLRADKLRERANGDTFRIVESLATHRDAVVAEVSALANGRDPYRGQSGNHWRAVARRDGSDAEAVRDRAVPYRLVVPETLPAESLPPLVIAFHGAGGDENMFAFAYGYGRLAQLARTHGFLLATPRTYSFARDEALLDALVTDIERDFEFDRSRVYLLGHSLGAGVAATLSTQSKVPIAAVALFAGMGKVAATPPPTLRFTAIDDPIVPSRRPAGAEDSAPRGFTERRIEHRGHTLFVGEYLPEAIEFLLRHGRS